MPMFRSLSRGATTALAVALAATLVGCSVGPRYERPTTTADALPSWPGDASDASGVDRPSEEPGTRVGPQETAASLADRAWWDVFSDPGLAELIDEALVHGHDVRLAAWQVAEARARFGAARSERWPRLDAAAGLSRGETPSTLAPGAGGTGDLVDVDLGISWEVDLWGRLAHREDAARARLLATEEARRGVLLSLVAEVASSWFRLGALDELLDLERRTEASFAESRELFAARLEAGLTSRLEVVSVDAAITASQARISELERRVAAEEGHLGVLLGRPPGPVPRSGALLRAEALPVEIPAGLPAQLLDRRPDLRTGERELAAALADVGVATANLYPTLRLTGSFGGVAPDLSDLFSGGRTWSIGTGLLGPVLQRSRLRDEQRGAVARAEQARVRWEADVNAALAEVATLLAGHGHLATAEERREQSVRAATEAVELASTRYVSGLASYLEVLDAQRELFPSQARLTELRLARLLALVDLYRALGGGWQEVGGPTPRPERSAAVSTGIRSEAGR